MVICEEEIDHADGDETKTKKNYNNNKGDTR